MVNYNFLKLQQLDQKYIWHPFTQEKIADLPISIKSAYKSYLYDYAGNQYLDLISSWWVNLHGHAEPKIAKAIYKQALNLEQVIFAGFTHKPAVDLASLIIEYLPENLTKGFFSDNGSTSVEVALKMAYQYWVNLGETQRSLFLSFSGGYHGDTFGAMSVGRTSDFHQAFKKLFFEVLSIPFADTFDNDLEIIDKEQLALSILQQYLTKYYNQIAAIILEPLVQGASGMRICRATFIEQVIELVRKHEILVIFDEVMTGFGRTGTCFALEQLQLKYSPDLLCLSKGITGGFLPLGLTVTTDKIYQAFLSDKFATAFAHGHSYTANPLACAAGIASFKLLQSSKTIKAIKNIHKTHLLGIQYLKDLNLPLEKFRVIGAIAAFDLNNQFINQLNLNQADFHQYLKREFLKQGLLLRPLGNTIYLLPPYSTSSEELLEAYHKIGKILELKN